MTGYELIRVEKSEYTKTYRVKKMSREEINHELAVLLSRGIMAPPVVEVGDRLYYSFQVEREVTKDHEAVKEYRSDNQNTDIWFGKFKKSRKGQ